LAAAEVSEGGEEAFEGVSEDDGEDCRVGVSEGGGGGEARGGEEMERLGK